MWVLPNEIIKIIFAADIRLARGICKRFANIVWYVKRLKYPLWDVESVMTEKMSIEYHVSKLVSPKSKMIVRIRNSGNYDLSHLRGVQNLTIICTAQYDCEVIIDVSLLTVQSLMIYGKVICEGLEEINPIEFGISYYDLMVPVICDGENWLWDDMVEFAEYYYPGEIYIGWTNLRVLVLGVPGDMEAEHLEHIYIAHSLSIYEDITVSGTVYTCPSPDAPKFIKKYTDKTKDELLNS